MWLSGQQKQPADNGEGQTGYVTMNGSELAVMLESERRGVELYAPAGYHWTPKVGQRVLVIRGQGEIPCIIGAREDGDVPDRVGIQARLLNQSGEDIHISAQRNVTISAGVVDIRGEVYVNGTKLEHLIERIARAVMMGEEAE